MDSIEPLSKADIRMESREIPSTRPKLVSYKPKQPKINFASLATSSIDEMHRLNQIVAEQRIKILELAKELKALKACVRRQDKALDEAEHDQSDFPYLFNMLNEDLRCSKVPLNLL